MNLKWLAEYCGTSVAMIERSYGRFLAAGADHQLALLAGGEGAAMHRATQAGYGGLDWSEWDKSDGWLREMDLLGQAMAVYTNIAAISLGRASP